jgi:hypothetical protein
MPKLVLIDDREGSSADQEFQHGCKSLTMISGFGPHGLPSFVEEHLLFQIRTQEVG